jgi:hypothetical protein
MAVTIYHIPGMRLSLSLESGGDLPDATTYYFIGYFSRGASYYQHIVGKESEEVSITTTSPNQQIRVSWEYSDGAGGWVPGIPLPSELGVGTVLKWDYYSMLDGNGDPYRFCNANDPAFSSEFASTLGHQKWCNVYSQGSNAAVYVGDGFSRLINTENLYTTQQGRAFAHPRIANRYDHYNVRVNINDQDGGLIVWFDGTDNDSDTLIDALELSEHSDKFDLPRDNTYSSSRKSLTIFGSLVGPGEGVLSRFDFVFLMGKCDMAYMEMNNVVATNHQYQYYSWLNLIGTWVNSAYYHNGNSFVLDSVKSGTSNLVAWGSSGVTNYGDVKGFYSKDMPQHQWRYYKPTDVVENSTFDGCRLGMTTWSGSDGPEVFYLTNLSFLNNDQDVQIGGTYSDGKDVHQTFECTRITTDRDFLRVFWPNTDANSLYAIWNIYAALDLTVLDPDGLPLENVSVIIENSAGEAYTGITGPGGTITLDPKQYTVEYDITDPDGYGYDSKTTDLSLMKITMEKDGYIDYNTEVKLAGVLAWTIAMQKPILKDDTLAVNLDTESLEGEVSEGSLGSDLESEEITVTLDTESIDGNINSETLNTEL